MCIKVTGKLTVYFESPFWVGVFEERMNHQISTCKVVFGTEPKDYEVYDFVLKNYEHLKFSNFMPIDEKKIETKINPKRLQRMVKKQTTQMGIGTKAQQSLKAEYEANKIVRKQITRDEKERIKKERFQQKQQKKKLKKRGH